MHASLSPLLFRKHVSLKHVNFTCFKRFLSFSNLFISFFQCDMCKWLSTLQVMSVHEKPWDMWNSLSNANYSAAMPMCLKSTKKKVDVHTWGLMYEKCLHTQNFCSLVSTSEFNKMCGAPRQVLNWHTYISAPFGLLATLNGYVGKDILKRFQIDLIEQHITVSDKHSTEELKIMRTSVTWTEQFCNKKLE